MDIFILYHITKIHLLQIIVVIMIIGFTVPRFFLGAESERLKESTLGLAMGIKSLLIILYQLLTEHTRRFKRWGTPRLYLILNALEIMFWAAVAFLLLAANVDVCRGVDCTLGWTVIALAVVMSVSAIYATVICWLDFRIYKASGKGRGGDGPGERLGLSSWTAT